MSQSVFSHIGFYSYVLRYRFEEALARLRSNAWPTNGWQEWACYRQGLFNVVNQQTLKRWSLPSGFAHAVSLAAVGNTQEAAAIARKMARHPLAPIFRRDLVAALAPYAPLLARELIPAHRAHNLLGLKVVLEARHGNLDHARLWLQQAMAQGADSGDAELNLLASNWLTVDPAQRLQHLNLYLASFKLAALTLKDPSLPPLVSNLMPAITLPPMQGPKVSVLMTAYNIEDRIGTAIEGVLNQTYQNLELLVADDCSTDGTAAVVEAYAQRDPRVRYMRLPVNAGTYVAKTRAFHSCTGEFVTCHDSDDWSHPQRLERQVRPLLQNPQLVATTSQWIRLQDDGQFYARLVYHMRRLNPSSPLFRKAPVLNQAGLWDSCRIGADSEFHSRLRLVFGKSAVLSVAQPLTIGAHRENSLMTAADTGYTNAGMSPTRLAYWEAWARWHIETLSRGDKPVMPPIDDPVRPFKAPKSVLVLQELVRDALDHDG